MNKQFHQEAGYALLGVIFIFAILAVLGTSIVMLSFTSLKQSNLEHDDQAAFYIAEAGLNYRLHQLETEVNDIYEDPLVKDETDFYHKLMDIEGTTEITDPFDKMKNVQPKADVTIRHLELNKFEVLSKGTIGDQARTVSMPIEINWEDKYEEIITEPNSAPLPPLAVFTSGEMNLDGGKVVGDIGTINHKEKIIKIKKKNILDGDIYVPSGNKKIIDYSPITDFNIFSIDESFSFPELPEIPKYPNELTSKTLQKNKLFVNEPTFMNQINSDITIEVADGNQVLVVNKMSGNITLKLTGDGILWLYILDTFDLNGNATINEKESVHQLNIFYKGNKSLKFNGNKYIYGSIFAEKASIELRGNADIYGNIFTGGKSVDIRGNPDAISRFILAPNADVTISGNGDFIGRIISQKFVSDGNGKVIFDEPFMLKGPISAEALSKGSSDNQDGKTKLTETDASPSITRGQMKEIDE